MDTVVQLKDPSVVHMFKWRKRTKLEKHCVFIVVSLLLIYPLTVLWLYSNIDSRAASLLNAMDLSADPCTDFFQYACGSWNKKHMIPEDRSSVSTFEVLADELQIILKDKIRDLTDSPMRSIVNELGGWPVEEPSWISPSLRIEILLGRLRGNYNQGILLEQWVGPDDKNSSVNIIQIDQMSFGLPSREYFLKSSSQKDKDAYYKLMVEIALLLGSERSRAEIELDKVLQFETLLANFSIPEADRQDTGAIYRKMSIKELAIHVPQFNWLLYLNTFLPTEVSENEPVVVYALEYLMQLGQLISETDIKTVHNYALWRLIQYLVPYLEGEYAARRADFKKVLLGVSAERVRWNQCVELVNKRLGMAVGALFIRDHFDPQSKKMALEMIHNIRSAFNELLEENDWMDEDTKKVARQKANAMNERIGYPDILTKPIELSKEYDQLEIDEDQFFQSILNLLKFESLRNLNKLRQPVNKERWTTEPAVVNAFYNPNKNDIVFPAGILQPLFYSQYFPKSLNYGGIGVVIGHEITHGFDDKGRQFDKNGNLKQWWNNATVERFRERASCIIDQYSSYVLEDIGLNINGKMTQGENIADNGGLKQSYRAFKKWEDAYGVEPLLPGLNLTHDQLFFLNYAQIWCGSMRPEDALSKIRSSVHSPGPIRVLGPLSNSRDFSKAFSCPLGSRMNPKKKCSVW
ncbi:Neprilysin-2 [Halotydeus destructor]|nr:Neprilysin-2 [Halotydeus destructor]